MVRVWVTREESADGPLCTALRDCGLEPVLEPVIEKRVIPQALAALPELGPDDWLVLTSAFAVEAVADTYSRCLNKPKVAVVGEPSAKLAREKGFKVELIGKGPGGEALWAELKERVKSGIICYPRSSRAKEVNPWGKVNVLCPAIYKTTSRKYDRQVFSKVDIIAVASPSAVEAVGKTKLPLASIGSTTSAAVKRLGNRLLVEAEQPTFVGLAQAIYDLLDFAD